MSASRLVNGSLWEKQDIVLGKQRSALVRDEIFLSIVALILIEAN